MNKTRWLVLFEGVALISCYADNDLAAAQILANNDLMPHYGELIFVDYSLHPRLKELTEGNFAFIDSMLDV